MKANVDLSAVSDGRLLTELNRRDKIRQKVKEKEAHESKFKEWLNRPSCKFVGRAYSPSDIPGNYAFANIYVEGNSKAHFTTSITVPEPIKAFFSNAWSSEVREEFKNLLLSVCNYFVDYKIEHDIKTVIGLLEIVQPSKFELGKDYAKEIKEEWEKSAIQVLSQFPFEDLNLALSNHYHLSHLVKLSIDWKTEHKVPDKKKVQLSKEAKFALSMGKLRG
jgi:hypothetical protein